MKHQNYAIEKKHKNNIFGDISLMFILKRRDWLLLVVVKERFGINL